MAKKSVLKVRVDQCTVEWTAEIPGIAVEQKSPTFRFQNDECYLHLFRSYDDTGYRLCICDRQTLTLPFDVTVFIVKGTDSFSCKIGPVWPVLKSSRCVEYEILKHIPEYIGERGSLCLRVMFHAHSGSNDGQGNAKNKTVQTPSYWDTNPCLESLSQDFDKLLDGHGDSYHDVKLKCGDHVFQAHRSVLSARSEVFSAMLHSDMSESRTGLVELQDMNAAICEEFVRYLYTGTIPALTVDKAKKFYEAGDKYVVRSLMQRCAVFLTENLTVENACECLALADAHSDREFKESVPCYILDNKIHLKDGHWLPFCGDHPTLAVEVLNRGFKSLSDK